MRLMLGMLASFAVLACGSAKPPPPARIFDCSVDDCESCATLSTKAKWDPIYESYCLKCQGKPDGTAGCDLPTPIRNGVYVIRGCDFDSDCAGLSTFCGLHTGAPQHTCTTSDAI